MINSNLKKRLDQLDEPNRTILEKLIIEIETNNQKEDIKNNLRTNIREYVKEGVK